jgi:hypothetical protein
VPNQSLIHRFIFVPVNIPGGCDGRPIDLRMSAVQIVGKAPRGFRNDFPRSHYGVHCFSTGSKSAVNPWVASTLSMMSANRWAGFLECMNNVVQNIRPEQRLERTPIDNVIGTFEEFVDVQFHPRVLKDAHWPIFV